MWSLISSIMSPKQATNNCKAPEPKDLFCCVSPYIPQAAPALPLILFLEALHNLQSSNNLQNEFLFPPYPFPDNSFPIPESTKVIELERYLDHNASRKTRTVKYYVYMGIYGKIRAEGANKSPGKTEMELQMYPEEAIREVKEYVVDDWFSKRREWWDKDVIKRDERVSWMCKKCGVQYHAKVLTVVDPVYPKEW